MIAPTIRIGALVVAAALAGAGQMASAADESAMMSACNDYAAKKLGVSTSDIASVSYEGARTDGTHAVNGTTTAGASFQCSFDAAGRKVVGWTGGAAARGCPADVTEADRAKYPDCK